MGGLSEAELHVQAMRLVCEALADREQNGIEVDWNVLRQMHDQMDALLQELQHKHSYDSSEIVDLRKDRDHWRQARQDAIAAGELMKAEIASLRQQLAEAQQPDMDSLRAEVERLRMSLVACDTLSLCNTPESLKRNSKMHPDYNCGAVQSVIQAVKREIALLAEVRILRQQLAEAQQPDAGAMRAEVERLLAFVNLSRRLLGVNVNYADVDRLRAALAELDAQPAPVAEPATCSECERLRVELTKSKDWASHCEEVRKDKSAELGFALAEIERLQTFVEKVRAVLDREYDGRELDDLSEALDELDAQPAPMDESAEGGK